MRGQLDIRRASGGWLKTVTSGRDFVTAVILLNYMEAYRVYQLWYLVLNAVSTNS